MEPNFWLREVLNLLFKHKYRIVAIFLVAAAASYAISLRIPKHYIAKAIIMVSFGREFIPISEVGDTRLPAPTQEAIINTEMQLITGRELTKKVVSIIGVENLYPRLARNGVSPATVEIAGMELGRNLSVENVSKSNLIAVYFQHENAQTAARALSTLVDALKDRHLQVFSNVNSMFLREQLKSYEMRLQDSQRSLGRFRQEHQMLGEEQGNALLGRRAGLEAQLAQETAKAAELQQKLDSLRRQSGPIFTSNSELKTSLNTLRRKEHEFSQKYNDDSQKMIALRDDIRLVEQQLKEQQEDIRAAECSKLEMDIKPLHWKIVNLKQQIQQVDRQFETFGKNSVELQDLKREVASNESNYQTYLKKVEEARISENMDQRKMTNITVVQQASIPVAPDGNRRQKVFRLGLLMALGLSFGTAFVLEYAPRTFTTPEFAERKLGLPIIATLDHRI